MHHCLAVFGMVQGYTRIQIDLAHPRAQLTPQLALAGIFEINIGTVLIQDSGFRVASPERNSLSRADARVNIWTGGGEIELKVNRPGPAQGQMAISSQPVPSHEQTAKAQAFRSFKGGQAAGPVASGPAATFADPRKPQTEATQTQKARSRYGGAVGSISVCQSVSMSILD